MYIIKGDIIYTLRKKKINKNLQVINNKGVTEGQASKNQSRLSRLIKSSCKKIKEESQHKSSIMYKFILRLLNIFE